MCTCFSVFFFVKYRVRFPFFRSTKIAGGFRASSVDRGSRRSRRVRTARRALHAYTQVNRCQGVCSTPSLEAHARCLTCGRPPPRSPPAENTPVPHIARRTREGLRSNRTTWRTTPAPRWPLWPRATRNSGCVLCLVACDSKRAAAIARGASSRPVPGLMQRRHSVCSLNVP